MAKIELTNITKKWGDFVGVDNFNLTIKDKEFLVLLGPSGCGKTTTMRMIAGLEEISSGEIKIDDIIVNNLEPKDRDISMVFQSYGLYPNMNVYENIRFPLKVRKINPKDHKRLVMRAVKMVELESFLKRRPAELSGGQRQGVAVARATSFGTKVVIMDEPTAALGVKESRRVLELIGEVRARNIPIILISHNMPHVFEVADRIHIHRLGTRLCVIDPKEYEMSDAVAFMTGAKEPPKSN